MGWQGAQTGRWPLASMRVVATRAMCAASCGVGRTVRHALAAAWLLAIAACSADAPETDLRRQMAGLHAAIEAREPSAMQQFLADDFVGNDNMDRRQARAYAALVMSRHRDVSATFGPLEVTLQPPSHATVAFDAMLAGGAGGWLPERAQVYAVTTSWRESNGEWQMYHASWKPRF